MGIFGRGPEVDPACAERLVNTDRGALRILAREQAAIPGLLLGDENIQGIGADGSFDQLTVVTTLRVFQVRRGRVADELGWSRVTHISLHETPDRRFVATVRSGNHDLLTCFDRESDSQAFYQVLHRMTQAPAGRRDIPMLYPDYYTSILQQTGKPATPHNMAQLIVRVKAFLGGYGHWLLGELHDVADQTEFRARFGQDSPASPDPLRDPDRVVDFLWSRNNLTHEHIRRKIQELGQAMVAPDSFLYQCGDELPEWDDE